jgi:hypothetical protein
MNSQFIKNAEIINYSAVIYILQYKIGELKSEIMPNWKADYYDPYS